MQRIRRIVFFCGGVLLPTITEAALAVVQKGAPTSLYLQPPLRELEWALATGEMSLETYCKQFLQLLAAPAAPPDLITGVPRQTAVVPGMQPLLLELSMRVELRLVADYPARWLEPILLRDELASRVFRNPVYVPQLRFERSYRALFESLIELDLLIRGSTMWVDWHSLRCMAAIREGVDAGIFVDARRLRRDLVLWGLLDPDTRM